MPTPLLLPLLVACLATPPCSCVLGPPIVSAASAASARDEATAVFVGVVQRIEFVPVRNVIDSAKGLVMRSTDAVATLRVVRSWKGALDRTVVVRSASEPTMCGASLEEGRTLLVFGQASGGVGRAPVSPVQRGDTIFTSSCSPTTDSRTEVRRIGALLGRPQGRTP